MLFLLMSHMFLWVLLTSSPVYMFVVVISLVLVVRDVGVSDVYTALLESTRTAPVFLPEPQGETRNERWDRYGHNAVVMVGLSVQPSSQDTYILGWRRFIRFCQWFETDPYLREVPEDWTGHQGLVSVSFKESVIVAFIQKLCLEEGLCPGTVNVYLAGVQHFFKLSNLDIQFLGSPWISSARTAVNLIYRRDHPIAGKSGLPFTCDMVVHAATKTFNTNTPGDRVLVIAMKMALTCLLRVSEYLPNLTKPHVNHWMRADDVSFKLPNGSIISSWSACDYPMQSVVSVIITVRSAKNDIDGMGHRFEFPAVGVSSSRAFDFASDMFAWATLSHPREGQPFLSYRNQWTLSYRDLTKAIKCVASELGLDPARYRTHFLRIGGASTLAAANVPDYVIQKLGRWKSLAFLDYIRLSGRSFDLALASIADPGLLTARDIASKHPGVTGARAYRESPHGSDWGSPSRLQSQGSEWGW